MRSGLSLFSVAAVLWAAVLLGIASVQADPGTGVPPWHHTAVSRLDQARPGPAAAAEAGPQKYLHIEMQFNDPTVLQNRDKFRIVDASGNEVGGRELGLQRREEAPDLRRPLGQPGGPVPRRLRPS